MALSSTMFSSDLSGIINDLPASVTWGSVTFNAVVSDISNGEHELELAGYNEAATLTIDALISSTTTIPPIGDTVTISGASYRILNARTNADTVSFTLTCGDLTA